MQKRIRQADSLWKNSKDKRKQDKTIVSFILQQSIEAVEYLHLTEHVYSSVEVERSLILQYNAGHLISIYPKCFERKIRKRSEAELEGKK